MGGKSSTSQTKASNGAGTVPAGASPGPRLSENPKPYRFLMLFRRDAAGDDVRAALDAAKFDRMDLDDWFKPQAGGAAAANQAWDCEPLNCSVLTLSPTPIESFQALTEHP